MLLLPESLHRHLNFLVQRAAAWKEIKWGAWALIAFYISLLSGIIVGLQYDYLNPFYSTTAIDLLSPYGRFLGHYIFFQPVFLFL